MNSRWWGLEVGQTYQKKQALVATRGTQQFYDMVSGHAALFNDELSVQLPVHADGGGWEEYGCPKRRVHSVQGRKVYMGRTVMARMHCPPLCGMSV
jgi:hypothetical protein